MLVFIIGALYAAVLSRCATVTYDWDIGYTTANPDGLAERQVIGVNGQWPPPPVELTEGDRVIINAHNSLPDQPMSLHAHGIFQNGTNYYEWPSGCHAVWYSAQHIAHLQFYCAAAWDILDSLACRGAIP